MASSITNPRKMSVPSPSLHTRTYHKSISVELPQVYPTSNSILRILRCSLRGDAAEAIPLVFTSFCYFSLPYPSPSSPLPALGQQCLLSLHSSRCNRINSRSSTMNVRLRVRIRIDLEAAAVLKFNPFEEI